MGMYTEIYVNIDLHKDTPPEVIMVIQAMCAGDGEAECLKDKPQRWAYLFNNGSFYTPNTECAHITLCKYRKAFSLLAKGDIKNYEGEIEAFFDFIKPWCETPDAFIGYHRYEENREPTLIYSNAYPE